MKNRVTVRSTKSAETPDLPVLKKAVRNALLPWFAKNRRDLPWRRKRTPYSIWISELMLQQTRVDQVVPYFERWMKRFPSLGQLALAEEREVLKLWEGLGYYQRARRIHQTARKVMLEGKGRLPTTAAKLRELPGVGPYTAAAIASLAFGEDVAVVDGNVTRVLARLTALSDVADTPSAQDALRDLAQSLLVKGRAGEFNEAMMELGATVCLPKNPLCLTCPVQKVCRACADGNPEQYPVKTARKKIPHKVVGAAVVRRRDGKILVAQRKPQGMLPGMWEFPGGTLEAGESITDCIVREIREELDFHVKPGAFITSVRHAFSHFTIELHAYWADVVKGKPRAVDCAGFEWIEMHELDRFAFGKADLRVIDVLRRGFAVPAPKKVPRVGKSGTAKQAGEQGELFSF